MDPVLLWMIFAGTAVGLEGKPVDTATLLPAADGRPTAIYVDGKAGKQDVTAPYQQARVGEDGVITLATTTAKEMQARHAELYSLAPKPETRYVLQFSAGSTTLTPESQAKLADVLRDAKQREGGEAVVVGHTDRVGDPAANDVLSLSRAKVIRDLLLGAGMLPDLVTAVGRGEREPVVPTEPGVAEAQNRRVEILVR